MDISDKKLLTLSNKEKAELFFDSSELALVEALSQFWDGVIDLSKSTVEVLSAILSGVEHFKRGTPWDRRWTGIKENFKTATKHTTRWAIYTKNWIRDVIKASFYTAKAIADKYNDEWEEWKRPEIDFTSKYTALAA